MITSDKNETLESILKKIQTPQELKKRISVYIMFTVTHSSSINHINFYIQIEDPELWEEIRKMCYPSIFEKIKKKLGF